MCTMLSAEFWINKVDYLVGQVLTRSFLPVFQRRSRWRRCTGCVLFVGMKYEQTALDSAHVITRSGRDGRHQTMKTVETPGDRRPF